jgi:hypothetical protein
MNKPIPLSSQQAPFQFSLFQALKRLLGGLVLVGPLLSQAALFEIAYEKATAFFKTPESPFASGHASKTELLSSVRQSYTLFQFEGKTATKTVRVSRDQFLRELDTAETVAIKKAGPLYQEPDLSSKSRGSLLEKTRVTLLDLEGAFARIRTANNLTGYVLSTQLEIPVTDPGVWLNLTELSLRRGPEDSASTKLVVPALSRLRLLDQQKEFGLFSTGAHQGWARLSEVVGRVDFAGLAWDAQARRWEKVLYRVGAQVVVVPQKSVPLTAFTAFQGTRNRALISGDHPDLPKGTRIELVKPHAVRWTQSEIKGHGLVWWKRDLLTETPSTPVSTPELMKKNLRGLSYDPKTKKGLASAKGIYLTTDGKNWVRLPQFGTDDWPVCVHPSGVWFVGLYKSTDEGKSFEPFVKFSELARTLQQQNQRNRAFTHLKVLDLQPAPRGQIVLKIDTGLRISKLSADIYSNQWRLLSP